jgi:thiamine-phosphate pyrophosphorylase
MKPLADCRLYTFVDTGYLHDRQPAVIAQQLCDGGSDLIQLRAKTSGEDEIRRLAEAILPITIQAGAGLVINDFPKIAQEVGAQLCHLGQEDFFGRGYAQVSEVISKLEIRSPKLETLRIGLSTHAPKEAQRAIAAQPAYIAVGPVFATNTKPAAKPVTLEYVRWAAANVNIPWFAIGGITLRNLDAVLAAGARRVCVVSAILDAPDMVKTCQQFKQRLLSAPQN